MHLELQTGEHIDIGTRCVIGRANIERTSGDVEWCGISVHCPFVASTV
jgi:hypothetical protein